MKQFSLLCLAFGLLLSTFHSVKAQNKSSYKPVRFLIGAGLEMGGDDVAEVYFTNGNSQSVKAGQGGSLAAGAEFQFPAIEKLLLRATVGYKYLTTQADNVHIRLTRVPIHFSANLMATQKLMIGAGLAMHQGIRFNSGGLGQNLKFDNAKGPRFEVAYAGIGLTYTAMKYRDQANETYSANAIGLSFTYALPARR